MNDVKHFDSRNPIWDKSYKPVFQREKLRSFIEDANANQLKVEVEYHYYRHYKLSRIAFCVVRLIGVIPEDFDWATITESVKNLIDFYEGYSALFECEVQFLNTIK